MSETEVRWHLKGAAEWHGGYVSRRAAERIAKDVGTTVQKRTTVIEDVGLHWLDCAGSSILADGTKQIALAFDDGRWAYPCGPNHVIHESVGSLEAAKAAAVAAVMETWT